MVLHSSQGAVAISSRVLYGFGWAESHGGCGCLAPPASASRTTPSKLCDRQRTIVAAAATTAVHAAQVLEAFHVLRQHGVDVVTLGQYMRPTKRHMAVEEFVTPAAFEAYQQAAEQMGFLYVASGPMVRSSYRAGEFYLKNVLQARKAGAAGAVSSQTSAVAAVA
jgi:lipoic acid synthetase